MGKEKKSWEGKSHASRKGSSDSAVTRILEFRGKTKKNGEMRMTTNIANSPGCLFMGVPLLPFGRGQDRAARLHSEARAATWQPQRRLPSGPRWPRSGSRQSVGTLSLRPPEGRAGAGATAPPAGRAAELQTRRRLRPLARPPELEFPARTTLPFLAFSTVSVS